MIEAFVGQVGGGKTFSSVRRMCNYMGHGGRVVSNILLTGYDCDSCDFLPNSPVITYLADKYKWHYQPGQYFYIPFQDMVELPGWFKRVPGGVDRTHRTFLCVDEATDLFDTLDRSKLNNDSTYRELFRFLRLSRHAHIDVLFICQDLNAINSRLRGLVGSIWKSVDLANFRLPGFRVGLPVNCFLLLQFDRTGKLELRREFVSKDRRIFALYESEAFHDALGISFSDPVSDGKISGGKKMSAWQKVLLFLALFGVVYSIHRSFLLGRLLDKRFGEISVQIASFKGSDDSGPESLHGTFSTDASADLNVATDPPSRVVVRGIFDFVGTNRGNYCHVDGRLFRPGLLTEYGLCKLVSKDLIVCVDGSRETVIVPSVSRATPEASAGSF